MLLSVILDGESRLTSRDTGLLLNFIQRPYFERRLAREILSDCHQEARSFDLLHMCNGCMLISIERTRHHERLRNEINITIRGAKEQEI